MFSILIEKDYIVIYKRPTNKEGFAIDQNEANAINMNLDIQAHVEGVGLITDRELHEHMPNIFLFDDIVKQYPNKTYNEIQLSVMANASGFISVCGGNGILSSLFGKDVVLYVTQGRELRPNYFGEESYWRKLSGANVIPVFDVISEINPKYEGEYKVNTTGKNDYTDLLKTIEETF